MNSVLVGFDSTYMGTREDRLNYANLVLEMN